MSRWSSSSISCRSADEGRPPPGTSGQTPVQIPSPPRPDVLGSRFDAAPRLRGIGAPVPRVARKETRLKLSPSEQDKLLLYVAGIVARDRRARGVKLNQPEAVALLSCWVLEAARDGRSVEELMHAGRAVLAREDVMPGVPELVDEVQVEATFPDGRKLVTLHQPIT